MDTKHYFHTITLRSNTSGVAFKLHLVPWYPSEQVNKLAFSKKSPQRPCLCSCRPLPFRKLFLLSAAKRTFSRLWKHFLVPFPRLPQHPILTLITALTTLHWNHLFVCLSPQLQYNSKRAKNMSYSSPNTQTKRGTAVHKPWTQLQASQAGLLTAGKASCSLSTQALLTAAPGRSYQWPGPGESVSTRVPIPGSSHSPAVCPWTRHLYLWVLIYKAGTIQYHLTCRVDNTADS